MAAEESTDQKLGEIFKEGFDLYSKIDAGTVPFNSDEFQTDVKNGIRHFEDATRLVNSIGMFSTNEIIDEIPTEHLSYLLLPYFLGQLSTKYLEYDREEALKIAEIYYKDFLKRCEDYGVCKSSDTKVTPQIVGGSNKVADLLHLAQERNSKIEMYRRKKELEEHVQQMKVAMDNEHVDDEIKRDFYLKLIDLGTIGTKEELQSIGQEKQILEFKKESEDAESHRELSRMSRQPKKAPLQPIIITKDAAQKAVFGLGYPSLPIMTVGEFYEQRVSEGIFPNEQQVKEMNEKMMNPEDPEEKEEREKAEQEALLENDDPEYLERQRNFDEYKDVVRRGAGNRYNRS